MKKLILSLLLFTVPFMGSCAAGAPPKSLVKTKVKKINARITYYYPERPFYKKVSDPSTKQAVEGVTVAAHPDFKFGTTIRIPELQGKLGDGKFVVQDRGTAVTSKKAAKGRSYVFDVYVASRQKMRLFEKTVGMYTDVLVQMNVPDQEREH